MSHRWSDWLASTIVWLCEVHNQSTTLIMLQLRFGNMRQWLWTSVKTPLLHGWADTFNSTETYGWEQTCVIFGTCSDVNKAACKHSNVTVIMLVFASHTCHLLSSSKCCKQESLSICPHNSSSLWYSAIVHITSTPLRPSQPPWQGIYIAAIVTLLNSTARILKSTERLINKFWACRLQMLESNQLLVHLSWVESLYSVTVLRLSKREPRQIAVTHANFTMRTDEFQLPHYSINRLYVFLNSALERAHRLDICTRLCGFRNAFDKACKVSQRLMA